MSEATLTKEQHDIERLVDDLPGYEPVQLFDKYGNPTPHLLQAFWEDEHGLTEEISLEELKEWVAAL